MAKWTLTILCVGGGTVWAGMKLTGTTGEGTYMKDAGGYAASPGCLYVESY
jgi:hypothetical protein